MITANVQARLYGILKIQIPSAYQNTSAFDTLRDEVWINAFFFCNSFGFIRPDDINRLMPPGHMQEQ